MPKKRIFCIGCAFPGDEFESVDFASSQTLLDADIILFQPNFGSPYIRESYNGQPLLSEHDSFHVRQYLAHWRSEIVAAVNAGKLVVIFLAKPLNYLRYTGEKQFSGSGRSRVTTNLVSSVSSYEAVPNLKNVVPKSGSEVRLEKGGEYLAPYWREFSGLSKYEVEFEGDLKVLLRSRAGDRIVGAALHGKSGTLLFLPPLGLDGNQWIRDAERDEAEGGYWTNDALNLGKRIVVALVNLADALKASLQTTPAPSWADASNYRLDIESKLETNIANMSSEIHALQAKKSELETQLKVAGNLRHLLYEKGKPLEQAVLESMNLLGFSAERYTDGDSEFDLVLSSDEGRCIGEVEGKDNAAVNIDKFSQLERNLQEDFARDEISIHAKGVLFGNAFRLVPPQERKQYFTDKCISAAKRIGAALVQTPDLFSVAQYLKQNPSDVSYASMCRNAILETAGDVVQFPPPPVQTATSVTQVSGVEEGDAEVQIIPAGNKTD